MFTVQIDYFSAYKKFKNVKEHYWPSCVLKKTNGIRAVGLNDIQNVIDLRVPDLSEILKSLHYIKSESVFHPYVAVHPLFAVIRLFDSVLLLFFNLIPYSQVAVEIIGFAI